MKGKKSTTMVFNPPMHQNNGTFRLGVNTLFMVPGDVGGTETFLRETLKALVQLPRAMELVLFTTRDNDDLFRDDLGKYSQVEFVKLNFFAANRPLRLLLEQTLLPAACWRRVLDCLWSPGYTAPFAVPCPQTVTIPDLQYKSHPEDMSRLERWVLDFLIRIACKRSRKIFTISEFSKKEVLRYSFAPEEKIESVLLGVDPSFGRLRPDEETSGVLKELIPPTVPFLLCVAHSYPHKNVHLLVDAFNLLSETIPHNLVLIGKPRRGEGALTASLDRSPCRQRIFRFAEGLPYTTLQLLYQKADIFVLPSAYEGFGLPVIEAMVAGTLVVTTREGSLLEVGGDCVFYLDMLNAESLAQSIMRVIHLSLEERQERIDHARQWAKGFTWQRSAEKLRAALEKAVSTQPTTERNNR